LASSEELAELANATGPGFDRLFLALMTRYHEEVLRTLQSWPDASASTGPQELIREIRASAQAQLDELRATLARSPE
jgi:predicted outer membrane protein